MTLATQQHLVWRALVGEADLQEAARLVRAGTMSAEARVAIYAEQYWLRLRDVLRSEFPAVRAVLGDHDFDVLAARYLRASPSTHHSLNWLGQRLEQFLRERPVDSAPFLADLAALEFARAQAFIAPDSLVADASRLSHLTPENAARARFTLTPAVRVVHQSYDVRPLYRAVMEARPWSAADPRPEPVSLVVFRQGFTVFHDAVADDEAKALELAQQGATLAELCGAFTSDDAVARAFQALSSWVNEGLVATIEAG